MTNWSSRQDGACALRRPGEPRTPARSAGYGVLRESINCLGDPASNGEERDGGVDVGYDWSGGGGAASVHGRDLHDPDHDPRAAVDLECVSACDRTEVPRVAVLIASRNGESTIGDTIRSVVAQAAGVFVVSDASTDGTAEVARAAGARVLALAANVGKPAALYALIQDEKIIENFDYVTILDDDTIVAEDFIAKCLAE